MTHHTSHRPVPPTAESSAQRVDRSSWARSGGKQPTGSAPHAQRPQNQLPGPHQGGQRQP